MEQELNIAAILRDKPKDTKLYTPIIGDCKLMEVYTDGLHQQHIIVYNEADSVSFIDKGKLYSSGECLLFPSKSMQNWSKFAWKKGDVLKCGNGDMCIFEKFISDDYTSFVGKFLSDKYECSLNPMKTMSWAKEDDEQAIAQYIDTIELYNGGKLNLETLEIEKPEPQFKDGDIVFISSKVSKLICCFKKINCGYVKCYIELNAKSNFLYDGYNNYDLSVYKLRLATDSEKQQLFDALAKEGKRWNAETKQIEDLPKKCEFKAFDKVLVRDSKEKRWDIDLFKIYHRGKFPYVCLIDMWKFCIPYNDQTAHLIGTTEDWKGGGEWK